MSHFTVAVITSSPDEAALEEALLPFHEYECTGYKQFVEWVDEHDHVLEMYKKYGKDFDTVEEFAQEEGYDLKDGRWGRYTNPNKKWDWWAIGGRWPNMLTLKDGEDADRAQLQDLDLDEMTKASREQREDALTNAFKHLSAEKGIDQSAAEEIWRNAVNEGFERAFQAFLKHMETKPDGKRPHFDNWLAEQPEHAAVYKCRATGVWAVMAGIFGAGVSETEPDPWKWAAMAPALRVFALIDADGKWHERSTMGWWGMTHDPKMSEREWDEFLQRYFEESAANHPERFVTIVDCHI